MLLPMPDDAYKYQVSPYVGGALFNIRASTAEEMRDALKFFAENAVELGQYVATITGGGEVTQTFSGHVASVDNTAATAAAPAQPAQNASGAPSCTHGPRIYKSGSNARGGWEAWMCSANSKDPSRCKPLDAKTGELWK